MAAENKKRTGNQTTFRKGQSGNPRGRPKQTQEQKDAMMAIRALAPEAAEVLRKMLTDEDVPYQQQLKAAEIVLERTYGKAEAKVELSAIDGGVMEEIRRRMAGEEN